MQWLKEINDTYGRRNSNATRSHITEQSTSVKINLDNTLLSVSRQLRPFKIISDTLQSLLPVAAEDVWRYYKVQPHTWKSTHGF
jgi:hypothetical protein